MAKKILLADDSVTIQKVVELTFMEEELEVITVGTGSEALERLEEVAPDLVIADVHMPGADGFEVCRAVKAADSRVPVLLLVGTFEPFEPDDATAAGADGHLKKPFDSQELIRIVDELLEAEPEEAGTEEPAAEAVSESPLLAAEPPDLEAEAEALFARPFEVAPGDEDDPDERESAAAEPEPAAAADEAPAPASLSDEDVERVARKMVELLGAETVREVAWEVVPDLAEVVIKDRLRELESQVD